MHQLLGKDDYWTCGNPEAEAFERVKAILASNQSRAFNYFDPSKPTNLQVDAAKNGLGVILLQESKPIAYASKSLTSERNMRRLRNNFLPFCWVKKIPPLHIWT